MRRLAQRLRRAWRFLAQDVWDVELSSLSAVGRMGVKGVRVVQLVFKGFIGDECPLHAAALAFTSLIALVPTLALSLALARGLGGADAAKTRMRGIVADWTQGFQSASALSNLVGSAGSQSGGAAAEGDGAPPIWSQEATDAFAAQVNALVDLAFEKMENVSFRALGGIGLLILLIMGVQVLAQMETSFNRVWGVAVGRPIWRKVTNYLSVLLIVPVLIVAATSLPAAELAAHVCHGPAAGPGRAWLASPWLRHVTVIATTSLAFTFLLMAMPNTKVRFWPGVTGGVVTALLLLAWVGLCAALQIGVAASGRIYGSFAAVPILLAWVFVSWEIVLFGAEVAFALQNCATYRMEGGAREANVQSRLLLALSIVTETARAMGGPGAGFEVAAFARQRRVPVRFLNEMVEQLVHAGILAEIGSQSGRYALLRNPAALRIQDVLDGVLRLGVPPEELGLRDLAPEIRDAVSGLAGTGEGAPRSATIQDLLRAGATRPTPPVM